MGVFGVCGDEVDGAVLIRGDRRGREDVCYWGIVLWMIYEWYVWVWFDDVDVVVVEDEVGDECVIGVRGVSGGDVSRRRFRRRRSV